jgi:outer membrane protein OmpA-like peptidoglycan-associated protein
MNKPTIYTLLAVSVVTLAACSAPPQKDIPGLTAEIDAANTGHFRQSVMHEDLADKKLHQAQKILSHWKKDQYWNIDERQKGLEAGQEAINHRLASEKELCLWLSQSHQRNHVTDEPLSGQHTAIFFPDNAAKPYPNEEHELAIMGDFLEKNPEISVNVTATTDTVGTEAYNQKLSERRAHYVKEKLLSYGAKLSQLNVKATGEAPGPKHVHKLEHRAVSISTIHPVYADCPDLK